MKGVIEVVADDDRGDNCETCSGETAIFLRCRRGFNLQSSVNRVRRRPSEDGGMKFTGIP